MLSCHFPFQLHRGGQHIIRSKGCRRDYEMILNTLKAIQLTRVTHFVHLLSQKATKLRTLADLLIGAFEF